ncbi:hypothetical protein FM115_10870 [Marinilactibacillus psychrotolerans 42ea]|uniref:Nucleotidyltransferase family protein n=2 Tax=Marinilactibacillus psychrotolerans TaxID=191770 RepID=A0A1R4KL68_9LACT|nr:hypothetical protein FM115_10870 [Marinilactibacillus psychrotolerans 42ea]
MMNYEEQLIEIINQDNYILSILKAVEKLNSNDTWICAGIIRNKVWDSLNNKRTPINDIDVIYYDSSDTSWEAEKLLEEKLEYLLPHEPWSVKNQARMHLKSNFDPFKSSYDGVAHFPETPTAVAIRIRNKEIEIMSPYGLKDLFEMKVKPTPFYQKNSDHHSIYIERVTSKKWEEKWRDLIFEI